ncbi:MAG: hypothetical protein ACYDD7_21790 [Acidimicrobiales bacterium]
MALLSALLLTACAGQAFRTDNWVRIVAPIDRSDVSLPIRIAWSVHPSTEIRSFMVLVDRSPEPPGRTAKYFVEHDDACKGVQLKTCLTPDYLQQRGIYQTIRSQLTLDVVPQRGGVWKSATTTHEVIVMPLDGRGRRIGEASPVVQFRLRAAPT